MPSCDACKEELGKDIEMKLIDTVMDYHDPSDAHGHGQIEGKVWECDSGHTSEYESSDDESDSPDQEDV